MLKGVAVVGAVRSVGDCGCWLDWGRDVGRVALSVGAVGRGVILGSWLAFWGARSVGLPSRLGSLGGRVALLLGVGGRGCGVVVGRWSSGVGLLVVGGVFGVVLKGGVKFFLFVFC